MSVLISVRDVQNFWMSEMRVNKIKTHTHKVLCRLEMFDAHKLSAAAKLLSNGAAAYLTC